MIHLSSCVFIHTRDDDLTSHPLTSVRTIDSLFVLPQLSDVIAVITDNDIGADGFRHIADAIKTCTHLTALDAWCMFNLCSCIHSCTCCASVCTMAVSPSCNQSSLPFCVGYHVGNEPAYVCIYVGLRACAYVCVCVRMCVCLFECMCTYVHASTTV